MWLGHSRAHGAPSGGNRRTPHLLGLHLSGVELLENQPAVGLANARFVFQSIEEIVEVVGAWKLSG